MTKTQYDARRAMSAARLCHTQELVMRCFTDARVLHTREDIAALTDLKLSSVCGRVRELLDLGLITVRASRRSPATQSRQQLLGLPVKEVC